MRLEEQAAAQMLARLKNLASILRPMVAREGSGHEVSNFVFKKEVGKDGDARSNKAVRGSAGRPGCNLTWDEAKDEGESPTLIPTLLVPIPGSSFNNCILDPGQ